MKKNLIMICIDGCRYDRAENSKIFTDYLPGTNFCSQSITYAPYTNSSVYAVFSGSYGNRNGCFSYWHSLKFKSEKFKTITKYLTEQNYYTHADIHSKLALPVSDFEKFEIYDETSSDLIDRHKNLIKLMKIKFSEGKNFFLYLHYEKIHTGIMNSVLKAYTNFSEEYFKNREKISRFLKKPRNCQSNLLFSAFSREMPRKTHFLGTCNLGNLRACAPNYYSSTCTL